MGSVLIKSSRYGNWNVLYIEKKKREREIATRRNRAGYITFMQIIRFATFLERNF